MNSRTAVRQINLQGLMVGNGCSGSETSSCGEWPESASFLQSAAGHELQVLFTAFHWPFTGLSLTFH